VAAGTGQSQPAVVTDTLRSNSTGELALRYVLEVAARPGACSDGPIFAPDGSCQVKGVAQVWDISAEEIVEFAVSHGGPCKLTGTAGECPLKRSIPRRAAWYGGR
jgi:hypothetical protein